MKRSWLALGLVISLAVAGCGPAAAPAPPASLPAPAPAPAPKVAPIDEAWAKVVAAAKKEGKLTIYSVHLYGDVAINVSRAFTERTGLGLEIVAGLSAGLLEKAKVERRTGNPIASVHTGNVIQLLVAKQDGLTQEIGYLPELKDEGIRRYDPWIDTEGHIIALSQSIHSPWINTNLVRPGAEPRSWRDLLKPEWRAKIGMGDPELTTSASVIFHALTTRGILEPAYFSELGKQGLRFYPSTRMTDQAMARGEVPLDFVSSSGSAGPMLREGAPLKAIDMAEGLPLTRPGVVALYQGAPHPNAARVFINWFFSQEGQTIFHKTYGSVSFRKDVSSFEPPQAQLTPANLILITQEDERVITKIHSEKVLSKLLRGR